MSQALETFLSIFAMIVGVAIVAVLVAPKSKTAEVIQATASGYGNALGVAISPVTGADIAYDLSYPRSNSAMDIGFTG